MTRPLVTVMLPCFNSADTLPLALGSVMAQSISDWECVCLDDGSSDATWDVLSAAARRDARFRLHRFAANRGRGAARQRALELAGGELLAFLDSDDWMYPQRLEREARWFAADARIAAVSACAAVTVGAEQLIGVLRPQPDHALPVVAEFAEPVPPPLIFPASMVRTDLAKRVGFDPAFRRSQDSDFLIRALLGRHYALASEVLYAYSQGSAASLERTLEGYQYRMRAHLRHLRAHPLRVTRTLAETAGKYVTYSVAGLMGLDHALIEKRWGPVDDIAATEFSTALAQVRDAARDLFATC